jgi:hypothetical protein
VRSCSRNDYAALDDLTERWFRELPDDLNAQWQRVFVLTSLARYEDAFEIIKDKALRAATLDQAHLLATVYVRALKPLDAARRIAQLSDQFDRSDEGLEGLLLFTATRTKEEVDDARRLAGGGLRLKAGSGQCGVPAAHADQQLILVGDELTGVRAGAQRSELAAHCGTCELACAESLGDELEQAGRVLLG